MHKWALTDFLLCTFFLIYTLHNDNLLLSVNGNNYMGLGLMPLSLLQHSYLNVFFVSYHYWMWLEGGFKPLLLGKVLCVFNCKAKLDSPLVLLTASWVKHQTLAAILDSLGLTTTYFISAFRSGKRVVKKIKQ